MVRLQLQRLLKKLTGTLSVSPAEKQKAKIDNGIGQLRIQLECLPKVSLGLVELVKSEQRFPAHQPCPWFTRIHVHSDDKFVVGPSPVIHLGVRGTKHVVSDPAILFVGHGVLQTFDRFAESPAPEKQFPKRLVDFWKPGIDPAGRSKMDFRKTNIIPVVVRQGSIEIQVSTQICGQGLLLTEKFLIEGERLEILTELQVQIPGEEENFLRFFARRDGLQQSLFRSRELLEFWYWT